jgi:hypothetical protein
MSYCAFCGRELEDNIVSCPACNCPNRGLSSVLNSSVVALLALFLGGFGAHRFYMKKYVSAIFMILTLGGLGFWAYADLIWALSGKFRDKYGLPINASRDLGVLPAVLIAVFVGLMGIMVIGLTASVIIPQFNKEIIDVRAEKVNDAMIGVVFAEEVYYAENGRYTDKYIELAIDYNFVMENYIDYGPIELYYRGEESECYSFTVSNKFYPDVTETYNSCNF